MKPTIFAIACAFALTACGHKPQPAPQDAAALPAPDAGAGSVTGMPGKPGPGAIGTPAPPAPASGANAIDAAPVQDTQAGTDPTTPSTLPAGDAVEPGPDDAAQLLRDYYAAINAHDYAKAWKLWSDGGAASNQSLQQFTNGFTDTSNVNVQVGTPGDEDAGAGQRYIEIPVTVSATHADGSRHRYAGSYTLHRTVVDGASADERAWRIHSAKLQEASP